MILVILGVCIVLLIGGYFLCEKFDSNLSEDIGACMIVGGGIVMVIALVATLFLSISVSGGSVLDEKIKMYSNENKKIEQSISETVNNYQKYESEVFEKCTNKNSIELVSLYPELKADKLVKKQIDTYISNNNKIKELKENKINLKVEKWWLYFGG
jgi:hypothetical protein